MTPPLRVAVTGAAGQIGYSLLFRIAAGECFGPDQPVILQLLEIPPAMKALDGVLMELEDCAFPLLHGVLAGDDAARIFEGADRVFLVGSKPRGKGMERSDLIRENGPIFVDQGRALNAKAAPGVRIVVVGNPCNTNCLIAMNNAPDIPRDRFTAMTRLDHNRATALLAKRAGVLSSQVDGVTVFGNHSATQYPDFLNARVEGRPVTEVIGDRAWLEGEFIMTVQQRGAAIIEARGASSAASAANAAICHMRDWERGTPPGGRTSMAVPAAGGAYKVPEGLVCGLPVTCDGSGGWSVVPDLVLDDFAAGRFRTSVEELERERDLVRDLLGGS